VSRDLSALRILLVQEWLYTWAGSERVLDELALLMPHADILAGIVTDEMRASHPVAARARETWLGRVPGARARHRWFLPLHAVAFSTFDARAYDLIISVSHSFSKMVRPRAGATHVSYCLSPPRYLWDLRDEHDRMATAPQRLALRTAGPLLRRIDRRGAARVHRFVSISRHIAERVRRCYGRDSAVVYPPVQPKPRSDGAESRAGPPFLLSLGRLVPYKRVDLAIRAAERLQTRLVVAGDGPERQRLERLAGKYTEFTGQVSEEHAAQLLAGCSAFVFCAEEDFGIAPIEANAHGKPVVAFRRGGATETLIAGKTAIFFDRQDDEAVADAIRQCLAAEWNTLEIENNAARFAPARFQDEMRSELQRALEPQ
jgi:glycosyltransferase involved in cell wall biosynthesis